MARTYLGRDLLNVGTAGQAVIRKVVAGDGIVVSSSGQDSGTGDVTISATGAAGAGVRPQFPLGGSRSISAAPATGVWTNVPEWVPFVAPVSFTGLVRAEFWSREAGVTVNGRLYNVSTGGSTTCDAVVDSQDPVEKTFTVFLLAGCRYILQVASNLTGGNIHGLGRLEYTSSDVSSASSSPSASSS